jgi:hypothetical protein
MKRIKCLIIAEITCPNEMELYVNKMIEADFVTMMPPMIAGPLTLYYKHIVKDKEQ